MSLNPPIKTPRLSKLTHPHHEAYCLSGLGRPFGINQDRHGFFYITDMDLHTVFRVSLDQRLISWLHPESPHWLPDQTMPEGMLEQAQARSPQFFHGPHSIDFDNDERAYVTTYYAPAIHVLDPSGQFIQTIGTNPSSHILQGPATAFFDKDERLLVTEYAQNAILAYNTDGQYLGGIGCASDHKVTNRFEIQTTFIPSSIPGGFNRPHMIKQGMDGLLYCADTWNHRISIFTPEGCFNSLFTHKRLKYPVSVSFMNNHDILVTSWSHHAIFVFNPQGKFKWALNDFDLNKPYDAQVYFPWMMIADSHHGRVLFIHLDDD